LSPSSHQLSSAMSQCKKSAKLLAVGCVAAAISPCFVQPGTGTTPPALARRMSQASIGPSKVEDNGSVGGSISGVASGFTVAAAGVLACGRLACSRNRQPSTACKGYSNEIGASTPLGFFDPAGFLNGEGGNNFRKYREAEIKHGRLAMMAAVGLLAQSLYKINGFQDTPGGIEAGWFPVGPGRQGLACILIFIGVCESFIFVQDPRKEPGNFGDPVGVGQLGQYGTDTRSGELNNGRAGMLAFLSIVVVNLNTGKSAGEQLGLI